jgi:Ca2+-binding EF-hand superfamily protein
MATNVLSQQKLNKGEFLGASFDKMDADKDGKISRGEYLKIHEERFDKFDVNDDGYLTEEEVKETTGHMSEEAKKKALQKAKIRFDSIDTDRDGKISKEEWISAHPDRPEAETVFDEIDTDGDGYITKKELKGIKGRFKDKRKKRNQNKN